MARSTQAKHGRPTEDGRTADPTRRRGRPRDPTIEQAILEAAQRQLAHAGFTGMTLEAIAADAGITPPTLRLRFGSKTEVAIAAIRALNAADRDVDTGSIRGDLLEELSGFQRRLLRVRGMSTLGDVLSEEPRNPALLATYREALVRPRRKRFRRLLTRAIERGELPEDVDLDLAINMLIGATYARYLAEGKLPRDWAERSVDAVLAFLTAVASERRASKAGPKRAAKSPRSSRL